MDNSDDYLITAPLAPPGSPRHATIALASILIRYSADILQYCAYD